MSWKFWQKDDSKGFEYVLETKDVPTSTLFRWFLYDTGINNPNKFAEAAGFNPISEEGEELEIRDSVERLKRVMPLKSFLGLMASITGEVTAENLLSIVNKMSGGQIKTPTEEEKEALIDMCMTVALSALVPAFSAALELGLIVNPGTFTEREHHEF